MINVYLQYYLIKVQRWISTRVGLRIILIKCCFVYFICRKNLHTRYNFFLRFFFVKVFLSVHLYKNLLNVPHAAGRTRKLRLCWGRWVRFSHSSAKEDHAASIALKSKNKLLRALQSQRNATQRNATLGILLIYRIVYCQISHCNSEKRLEMFYWDNYYQFEIVESDYCNAILYRVVEKNCVFTGTSYIQCDTFFFLFFFVRRERDRATDNTIMYSYDVTITV